MNIKKLKERLHKKLQRAIERDNEIQAEKIRKRIKRLERMKPGARRAITEGLIAHKTPLEVMKEEYSRRKYEREKKYKHK